MSEDVLQKFVIDGELISMNEYVNACRSHYSKGSRLKKDQDDIVMHYIRKYRIKPMKGPIEVGISWIEGRRRNGKMRDVDGIAAGTKFILDALVKCGIIPDDNPRIVRNVYHYYKFNSDKPHIEVTIMPYDPNGRTIHYMPITGID